MKKIIRGLIAFVVVALTYTVFHYMVEILRWAEETNREEYKFVFSTLLGSLVVFMCWKLVYELLGAWYNKPAEHNVEVQSPPQPPPIDGDITPKFHCPHCDKELNDKILIAIHKDFCKADRKL